MWACPGIAKVVELFEYQNFVGRLGELIIPFVDSRIRSNAHRFSNFSEPSVGTNNEICIRYSASVSNPEWVFVHCLDWTPCLIQSDVSKNCPKEICKDRGSYIDNNAATVKQCLAFFGKVFVDDIETLPGRLVEMCSEHSRTGPSDLIQLFLFDAVGTM